MATQVTRKSCARRESGSSCIHTASESASRGNRAAWCQLGHGFMGGMFQMDRSVWPGRLKEGKGPASLRRPHRRRSSSS